MFHSKHFTLTEAQKLLPALKPRLSEITELKQDLDQMDYDIYRHHYFGGVGANGTGKFPPELERLVKLLHQITSEGIIIKGIDNGLVDFPHIRENGDEVYLCFLLGEDDILYWHEIKDGFAGRRGIQEL